MNDDGFGVGLLIGFIIGVGIGMLLLGTFRDTVVSSYTIERANSCLSGNNSKCLDSYNNSYGKEQQKFLSEIYKLKTGKKLEAN